MLKDFLKLFILTIFFTIVVFFLKTTIFTDKKDYIEEKYLEPTIQLDVDKKHASSLIDKLKEKSDNDLLSANKYYFVYIPNTFKNRIIDFKENIETYLKNKNILKTISDLRVNFYEESKDRRWKMKNKTVKIFNPEKMWEEETQNIFIHEFAHYIDLYYFDSKQNKDLSNEFYNISWVSTKVLKQGQTQADFVSGYAMTNKYEDFAESLTYFVIANSDFKDKAETSEILENKYLFFKNKLFTNNFLIDTKFTSNLIIRDYYRDITKMNLDLKKFLQYFKK